MDTKDIATKLVELRNAGENTQAINTLYSDDIVSIEVNEPMREVHGIEAVRGKAAWWVENHEVHSHETRGPWVNGDHFIVEHTYDITFKPTGVRNVMNEKALHTVRDGKIVQEQFFY